jgi:hypothetical protein
MMLLKVAVVILFLANLVSGDDGTGMMPTTNSAGAQRGLRAHSRAETRNLSSSKKSKCKSFKSKSKKSFKSKSKSKKSYKRTYDLPKSKFPKLTRGNAACFFFPLQGTF